MLPPNRYNKHPVRLDGRRIQAIINNAPFPSHNNPTGRRPHAHLDYEKKFVDERQRLGWLELAGEKPQPDAPRLWALLTFFVDYDGQTENGHTSRKAGAARIIIDKDKNFQDVVSHGKRNDGRFERLKAIKKQKKNAKRQGAHRQKVKC